MEERHHARHHLAALQVPFVRANRRSAPASTSSARSSSSSRAEALAGTLTYVVDRGLRPA
jgi:hypothetical protein